MKKQLLIIASFALLTGCIKYNPEITVDELKTNIGFLASDSLKGRMTGSKEIQSAANYLAGEFTKIGLTPLGDSSTFLKNYKFIGSTNIDKSTFLKSNSDSLNLFADFTPLAFSADASGDNVEVVFAGFGAEAPEKKYNDYGKVEAKDKVVIVLKSLPEENNPHSEFGSYSSQRSKTRLAQQAGAKAIIFVNGFDDDSTDQLSKFEYDRAASQSIPAYSVKRSIVNKWLKSANKPDLTTLEKSIASSLKPNSFVVSNLKISFASKINFVTAPAFNVVALLPGSDSVLAKEYVVIGAHYDHWGMGGNGSLYRGKEPQIHNGADDNASGTAGVIEIAQALAGAENHPKRSVIFALFSGEELGLLGSEALAQNFPVPISQVTTMINFDMIGRMDSTRKLIIHGMGTSPEFKPLLDSLNKEFKFNIAFKDDGFGPSDHSSFYTKDIPVMFFFTDLHSDYHRPTDDADKINYTGEKELLDYALKAVLTVTDQPVKPVFTKVKSSSQGRSMGFKVSLGLIPDYAAEVKGMKITAVNPGSAAEKAGLKGNDIIVKLGDNKIENIYDYTGILGTLVAGKTINLVYIRDGKEIKTTVTPVKRN